MLLEFDLAGAEWVVTSYLCQDKKRLDVVRSGKSPHVVTGAIVFGPPEALVLAEHKALKEVSDPDELLKARQERFPELLKYPFLPRTKTVRQAGKGCNFQLDYREGYRAYAVVNEMAESEAKRQVHAYRHIAYPGLLPWYASIDREVRDTRTLTNCFGRQIYFQGALEDGTFRKATNFKSQSTVFDVTGRAMSLMLDDESADFEPAELLAQVHDSLLTQYLSRDFRAMARYAIKLALDYMSPTLHYNSMDFTLGVGLKVGHNWGRTKEIAPMRDEDRLALSLEQAYDELQRR